MTASRLAVASLAVAFLMIAVPHSAFGQAAGGAGAGGNRQNRQNRQPTDPAAAREQQLNRIKTQLGASDDEWKVLSPKVDKLLTAQQDARGGGGRGAAGAGGRGGRGNRGGNQAQPAAAADTANLSAVAKATAELRAAVADKSTSPEEISRKLTALHEAKDKAKAARLEAQKDLKELLTARQEALLVQSGMLE